MLFRKLGSCGGTTYQHPCGLFWSTAPLPATAARVEARVAVARALKKAEGALARERQFHRKVDLNARVRELRAGYEKLDGGANKGSR